MTSTGTPRRPWSRRIAVSLAVVAAGAIALTSTTTSDTLASFADDVWAKSTGAFTAARFDIEGSVNNADFSDHVDISGASELRGSPNPATVTFATPIVVRPGETAYAPLYLRTKSTSVAASRVSVSAAQKQPSPASDQRLWDTYFTYGARVVPADAPTTCNATVFSESRGTALYPQPSSMNAPAPTATFTLGANGSSTVMVCFAFSLNASVANAATATPPGYPDGNGKLIYPYWTFTGES